MILSSTDNLTNAIIILLHVHRELELREESFMFIKERLTETHTQALLSADVQQVYGILQVGGGFHKFCTVKSVVI